MPDLVCMYQISILPVLKLLHHWINPFAFSSGINLLWFLKNEMMNALILEFGDS